MLSLQSSEMERYGRDFGIAKASVPLNQPRAANEHEVSRELIRVHSRRFVVGFAGGARIRTANASEVSPDLSESPLRVVSPLEWQKL
jgi:hypothetical protein